jgi:hypothetical protein
MKLSKTDQEALDEAIAEVRAEELAKKKSRKNKSLKHQLESVSKHRDGLSEKVIETLTEIARLKKEFENIRKLASLKDYIGCLVVAERVLDKEKDNER